MDKIINTSALTDQLKILLWDRSKTREELAELVIGLIEEAGEEIVRCQNCKFHGTYCSGRLYCKYVDGQAEPRTNSFCSYGERRDSDG